MDRRLTSPAPLVLVWGKDNLFHNLPASTNTYSQPKYGQELISCFLTRQSPHPAHHTNRVTILNACHVTLAHFHAR